MDELGFSILLLVQTFLGVTYRAWGFLTDLVGDWSSKLWGMQGGSNFVSIRSIRILSSCEHPALVICER